MFHYQMPFYFTKNVLGAQRTRFSQQRCWRLSRLERDAVSLDKYFLTQPAAQCRVPHGLHHQTSSRSRYQNISQRTINVGCLNLKKISITFTWHRPETNNIKHIKTHACAFTSFVTSLERKARTFHGIMCSAMLTLQCRSYSTIANPVDSKMVTTSPITTQLPTP